MIRSIQLCVDPVSKMEPDSADLEFVGTTAVRLFNGLGGSERDRLQKICILAPFSHMSLQVLQGRHFGFDF